MLAVAASVGTMFADGTKIGDLYYNLNATDKTAEVTYELESDEDNYKGLTTANIPASVTYEGTTYSVTIIGYCAFNYCSSLTSVTIPNSVTSIGNEAFSGCSGLTSMTIPNSVTSIGGVAFSHCSSLTSIEIPNSVTSIESGAFYSCSGLTKVNITDIAAWCNIAFGDELSNPLYNAKHLFVNDVEVTDLVIPNGVTSIGQYALYNCSGLTSVTIGNSVISIGKGAFQNCSGLTSVILGTSVKVIEEYVFDDCTAIETITCYSMRPPTVNKGVFETLLPYSTIIYVPANYLNTYMMHDFWGMYDVRPIGAATAETTSVQVSPGETTATIVWPTVGNAATYEMVIKDKNGNVVCTLIFNSNGQLTEIAFNAPTRDNATQAAGFEFTVTGLEEGTSYNLTITAKDSNGSTLDEKTMAFTTAGGTGVEDINVPATSGSSTKILRNGEVLILRGGKMYNLQGVEVK